MKTITLIILIIIATPIVVYAIGFMLGRAWTDGMRDSFDKFNKNKKEEKNYGKKEKK